MALMDYTQQRREVALRRDPPVVGHVDAMGYVVCLACGVAGKPIHYGATYSGEPCDKCGVSLELKERSNMVCSVCRHRAGHKDESCTGAMIRPWRT